MALFFCLLLRQLAGRPELLASAVRIAPGTVSSARRHDGGAAAADAMQGRIPPAASRSDVAEHRRGRLRRPRRSRRPLDLLKNETLPECSATRQVLAACDQPVDDHEHGGAARTSSAARSMTILKRAVSLDGRIRLREKLMCLLLLAFLVLSFCSVRWTLPLYGFHFPEVCPIASSFLFPFVQLFMAIRLWAHRDTLKKWTLVPAALVYLCC